MDNNFNSLSLVQLIVKWKWHILIITVAAALCGAIFSGSAFITPRYKSEAIAYPANISPYSEESETEQMLQIINSQSICDSIIEKFNLWEHYNIDKNYKYAKTYMMAEYHSNIKISKTPYEAVSVVVSDADPDVACNIAKEVLHYYDMKVQQLHKSKNKEVVLMYERQLRCKQKDIDSLKQRMKVLSATYGVTDYASQSREVTRSFLSNSSSKSAELKENLEKYGPEIIDLNKKIESEATNYVRIKGDYEQELRFLNSDLSYSNVITEPFPADKKSFPVRWIIVTLCGFAAFVLSIMVLFIIENRKRLTPANQ